MHPLEKYTAMHRLLPILVALLLLAASAGARAQSDGRPETTRTPDRAQMKMAGPLYLELVVDPKTLTLYLTDHGDTPVSAAGGSAKAIITGGRERYVVILSPAGENVLAGGGEYKLGAYNLISLMVALPDQELQHVKFVHPKGAKPPPKKKKAKKKSKSTKKKAKPQ